MFSLNKNNAYVDLADETNRKEMGSAEAENNAVSPEAQNVTGPANEQPYGEREWLNKVEQKVQTLKAIEEEKQQKKQAQEESLKKIEALKEELANQQLAYEISSEELEKLEEQWVKEKEELVELIIK